MKSFLLFLSAMCLFGCEAHSGDLKSMESAEKEWNKKASQQLLAYMSLETMFPDKNVRALAEAAGKGKVKKVDKLVSNGVDVNSQGTGKATPLFWAMKDIDGFTKLLELGADPNVVFDDGGTVMHWAAKDDDISFLRVALKYKGDSNVIAGDQRQTPIFETIGIFGDIGKTPDLDLLIDAGADVNYQNVKGNSPTLVAASLGRFDIVYKLLESGADYTVKNKHGSSLETYIESKKKALDPNHDLYKWLVKVETWLNNRKA
jgi:ankyrin repeat protein